MVPSYAKAFSRARPGRPRPMSLTFKATGSQAVPVDFPVRWSGFLERGRPRPLNPPFMQTPVWEFGFKVEASASTQLDFGVEYSGFRVPLAVPAVPVQTKATILNDGGRLNALISAQSCRINTTPHWGR